jgi:WD40 repeat protein
MESLKELLRQCSKETLEDALENVCEVLQVVEQGKTEQVKRAIYESLTKQQRKEQRQQENDRNSFAVVLGTHKILDVVGKQMLQGAAGAGGRARGRACTGLMVVSSDVLAVVSTFLAWEKVELRREIEVGGVVYPCLFSPCGNFILTSPCGNGGVGELKLWGATSGELVRVFECSCELTSGCFSPDGETVVFGDEDILRLWNVETGTLRRTLEGHAEAVTCVDVSPDGAHALSGSHDCTVRLWNLSTDVNVAGGGILECAVELENFCCLCCLFSPNGALFLFGDGESLKLYDSTTHQLQHTLTGHSDTVVSCSFAPGGASIVSGSYDCTLKVWCAITGQLLQTLYGHTGMVSSCAFSPNGLTIVSSSRNETLRLWTAATGRLQQIVDEDCVSTCCFSPDGQSILSGYNDGFAKVWNVPSQGAVCR